MKVSKEDSVGGQACSTCGSEFHVSRERDVTVDVEKERGHHREIQGGGERERIVLADKRRREVGNEG